MIEETEKEASFARDDAPFLLQGQLSMKNTDIFDVLRELLVKLVDQFWPPVNQKAVFISIVSISQALPGMEKPLLGLFEKKGVNFWVCLGYFLRVAELPLASRDYVFAILEKVLASEYDRKSQEFAGLMMKPFEPGAVVATLVQAHPELRGVSGEELAARYPKMFGSLWDCVVEELPATKALHVLKMLLMLPGPKAVMFEFGIVERLFGLLAQMRGIQMQQAEILDVLKSIAGDVFGASNEAMWASFFSEMEFALTRKHRDRTAQCEFFEFLLEVSNPEVKLMFLQSNCLVRIMETIRFPACRQAHGVFIDYLIAILRTAPQFAEAVLQLPHGFHRFVNRIISAESDNAIPIVRLCISLCSISDEFLERVVSKDLIENLHAYLDDGDWDTKTACFMLFFHVVAHTEMESVINILTPYAEEFCMIMENVLECNNEELLIGALRVMCRSVLMVSHNTRFEIYKTITDFVQASTICDELANLESHENEVIRQLASSLIESLC